MTDQQKILGLEGELSALRLRCQKLEKEVAALRRYVNVSPALLHDGPRTEPASPKPYQLVHEEETLPNGERVAILRKVQSP